MYSVGYADVTSCLQEILEFRMSEAIYLAPRLDANFGMKGLGDMFTQSDLITHNVRIVVHLLSCFVRSWSAAVVCYRCQSFHYRLVWSASKKRYLAFGKFHLSISTANRIDAEIYISRSNEYFRTEIGRD